MMVENHGKAPTEIDRLTDFERLELERFCTAVLIPVIADGQIQADYEDGVLMAAFRLYGVDQMVRRDIDEVDRIVNAFRTRAGDEKPAHSRADGLADFFRRMKNDRVLLTENDRRQIEQWLTRQAEEMGLTLQELVQQRKQRVTSAYSKWKHENLEPILGSLVSDSAPAEDPGEESDAEDISRIGVDDEEEAEVAPAPSSSPPEAEEVDADPESAVEHRSLFLTAESGSPLKIQIKTDVGKTLLTRFFGDESKLYDEVQFTLDPTDGTAWNVIPNPDATNETLHNGAAISSAAVVKEGDVLAVGRESKGVAKLPLTVRLSTPADLVKESD
jgi:hypothetical protein